MPNSYFYVITPNDIYYEGGDPLPESGPILQFISTPEDAHAKLIARGFSIPIENDIFMDDGLRFKQFQFQTGVDGISSFLGQLTEYVNPFSGMMVFGDLDVRNMRFQKLTINRYIQPGMKVGGKYIKHNTRRIKKQFRKKRI